MYCHERVVRAAGNTPVREELRLKLGRALVRHCLVYQRIVVLYLPRQAARRLFTVVIDVVSTVSDHKRGVWCLTSQIEVVFSVAALAIQHQHGMQYYSSVGIDITRHSSQLCRAA